MPESIIEGSSSTFYCLFNSEMKHLYSVKWYRGNREFYRYLPNDNPKTLVFPVSGIDINVNFAEEQYLHNVNEAEAQPGGGVSKTPQKGKKLKLFC